MKGRGIMAFHINRRGFFRTLGLGAAKIDWKYGDTQTNNRR